MAQTVGCYAGLRENEAHQAPRIGFLLGSRNFTTSVGELKEGDTVVLTSTCSYMGEDDLPSQFDCTANLDGVEVARATLTVYQPRDIRRFCREPARSLTGVLLKNFLIDTTFCNTLMSETLSILITGASRGIGRARP